MVELSATDSGQLVKMEVDYSSTCDEKIPAAKKMASDGKLIEALESLLSLEKQTRTGADTHSTGRVLVTIVQICFEAKDWNLLSENIVLLSKRRSQMKQAVTKMVQECCTYVDQLPTKELKLKLIDTLRTVTEGKIYVEIERARLTHKLSMMKEADGDTEGAADVLQELQVETFGSMEKKEKVELILEQMRLCLAKKDYIRTQIISKKINTKFFESSESEPLKLKYYNLMIELDQHEGSYLAICKHYRALFDTPGVQEDTNRKLSVLRSVVLYLVLSPYDNEQSDLTYRVAEEKSLQEMPGYKNFLKLFTTNELIKWSGLCALYETELRSGTKDSPATHVFDHSEEGNKRWRHLKDRVVQHNIRVMAKYYTRISLKRMAQLLDLPESDTEEFLSSLVVNKTVQAKTDRLEGIVSFSQVKDPNDMLNEWSVNINSLMQLVNKTTHLINKEEMVHRHLIAKH